jgi:hypothetical protein
VASLKPSKALLVTRTPVRALRRTRKRLADLLEPLDEEGWRHPFAGSASIEVWQDRVNALLDEYRRAADPLKAANALGDACRRDPRLLRSPILVDQFLVWLLEIADGVVWRGPGKRTKHYRSAGATAAEGELRTFFRALSSAPRGDFVAASLFMNVYRDAESRVQNAYLRHYFGETCSAALHNAGLVESEQNQRQLGASHGRRLEITLREVARILGVGVTRVRERRDVLIADPAASASAQLARGMERMAAERKSGRGRKK